MSTDERAGAEMQEPVRVLVCGSRVWTDGWIIHRLLDGIDYYHHAHDSPVTVIEGGARGADHAAAEWVAGFGDEYPKEHVQYEADWDTHGRSAGPIRNQQMLDEGKPTVVLAFSDDIANSKGTADMVRRAKKAGVPVYVISHG